MAYRCSRFLILFGVIALSLGQVVEEAGDHKALRMLLGDQIEMNTRRNERLMWALPAWLQHYNFIPGLGRRRGPQTINPYMRIGASNQDHRLDQSHWGTSGRTNRLGQNRRFAPIGGGRGQYPTRFRRSTDEGLGRDPQGRVKRQIDWTSFRNEWTTPRYDFSSLTDTTWNRNAFNHVSSQLEDLNSESSGPSRPVVSGSTLNQGRGFNYNTLTSGIDDHGNRLSVLGRIFPNPNYPSAGVGLEYGTDDGRIAFGAGVSNEGYRVGGRIAWPTDSDEPVQGYLSGSYGQDRLFGTTAGVQATFRLPRAADKASHGQKVSGRTKR